MEPSLSRFREQLVMDLVKELALAKSLGVAVLIVSQEWATRHPEALTVALREYTARLRAGELRNAVYHLPPGSLEQSSGPYMQLRQPGPPNPLLIGEAWVMPFFRGAPDVAAVEAEAEAEVQAQGLTAVEAEVEAEVLAEVQWQAPAVLTQAKERGMQGQRVMMKGGAEGELLSEVAVLPPEPCQLAELKEEAVRELQWAANVQEHMESWWEVVEDLSGHGACKQVLERSKCRAPVVAHPVQACEHGWWRTQCKDCCTSCVHGRQRSQCKECGGGSICEHGRQRSLCKECGGGSICEHGRRRSVCKDCGGGSICEHGRERSKCKECGGSSFCEHGRQHSRCKECDGGHVTILEATEVEESSDGEGEPNEWPTTVQARVGPRGGKRQR